MNSKNAESLYAKGIFNAFLAYYKHHYGSANIPFQPVMSEPAQEAAPQGRPFVTMQPVAPTPKEGLPSAVPDERKTIESTTAPVTSQPVAPQPVAPQPVAPQPVAQPVAQPEVKAEPKADVVQPSDAPVFKVQVLTSKNKLKANDKQLEGLSDVSFYEDGGLYKYTVGSSEDYNVIYRLRKEIVAKYPNSFIIAFKNGVRTDVQEAIKEFKRNKRK